MKDPVCVITGGSRGIGLATALRLARRGARLVLTALHEAPLAEAARQASAAGAAVRCFAADVGDAAQVAAVMQRAVEAFGRIDVLVNNAGFAARAPVHEMPEADVERSLAANIGGVLNGTRAVWPIMLRQGGGVIVNVSSVASIDPFPGFALYGSCKTWVNAFTRATAAEGAAHGIRVFAVAPGAVETRMLRAVVPDFPAEQTLDPDAVAAEIERCLEPARAAASGQTFFVQK